MNETYWAPALRSCQASQFHPQRDWTGFQQVLLPLCLHQCLSLTCDELCPVSAADAEDASSAVRCCTQGSPDCTPWLLNHGLVRLWDEAERI